MFTSTTKQANYGRKETHCHNDPASSLSHNYIYEVAALIKRKIIKAGVARHIVILTNIMFFFQIHGE